jgi:hypothetical protein
MQALGSDREPVRKLKAIFAKLNKDIDKSKREVSKIEGSIAMRRRLSQKQNDKATRKRLDEDIEEDNKKLIQEHTNQRTLETESHNIARQIEALER